MALVLVPAALLGFEYRSRFPLWLRRAWLAAILGLVTLAGAWVLRIMFRNAGHVPEWDFRVFWMYGQLMAKGANVFDPAQFQQFLSVLNPSSEFIEDVLKVGATYPPPTMFLFVPLGWFNIHAAYAVWYLIQTICLVSSAYLLQSLFFPSARWGFALAGFLLFCLRSSWETINLGQTNFLFLLLLLLYWRDRERPRSGLWLALAVNVKFYAAALLIDILVRRRWRTLAWVVVSTSVMWLASLALLGRSTFLTYFLSPPASRVPHWAYVEQINQSLLAVILRGQGGWEGMGSPVMRPMFLVLGAALVFASIWLAYRGRQCCPELGIALAIVMGLLLYPGTLAHYALVLIVPLLALWVARDRLPGRAPACAILAGVVYGLAGFTQGNAVFAAFVLSWIALAAAIVYLQLERKQTLRTPTTRAAV